LGVLERSGSGFGVDEDGSSAASLHLCRWREVAVEGKRNGNGIEKLIYSENGNGNIYRFINLCWELFFFLNK
jgi:hypothetical protein